MAELTPREIQIINLIADGHADLFIAKRLGLSGGTIKVFINHIRAKIAGPRLNRVELVLWWLRRQGCLQDKEIV